MPRYRERKKNSTAYNPYSGTTTTREVVYAYISESSYPGSCNVVHSFTDPASGYQINPDGKMYDYQNYSVHMDVNHFSRVLGPRLSRLNWGKLPTSSEFGIIQILAEIDDTIAIFTRRWWSQLSYGSFNWGLLPFIQDLVAVAETCRNILKNLSAFSYEDEQQFSISGSEESTFLTYSYEAKLRKTGLGDISFHHPGSIALDRLGFHPDLSTAWDLIPLSFLVDYIFPIGDYLDSLKAGGWVKAMYFSGWTTYDVKYSYVWDVRPPVVPHIYHFEGSGHYFSRYSSGDVLYCQSDNVEDWVKLPSVRQLVDLFYVLVLPFLRRRSKK